MGALCFGELPLPVQWYVSAGGNLTEYCTVTVFRGEDNNDNNPHHNTQAGLDILSTGVIDQTLMRPDDHGTSSVP